MAFALGYGNFVSGSGYAWRVHIVVDVADESATQITFNIYGQFYNEHRILSHANGSVSGGGQSRSWNGSTRNLNSGNPGLTSFASYSVTLDKGSIDRTETFSARFQVTGGYGNGTSNASVGVTVPAITYSAPNAPSNCSASRKSDAQATVTWSNGSTSITQPRTAVLVERQTDSGSWVKVASRSASATNYTDNGISADHRYAYRVRAQGAGGTSGYSTSGYIYTTPAAPSSVTAAKDSSSSVTLSAEGLPAWAEGYEVGRTADGGVSWSVVGTADTFPWTDASAPAGTIRYRVRSYRGDLYSAYVESNSITTITPPLAPTVQALPSVVATGSALTAQWVPNHPDGSAQTQAQVEYTVGSGSPQTATVQGAGTSYRLPSSATASAGTVKVRVRTHGLDDEWGAWSAAQTVRVAVPPSAIITVPPVDGARVGSLPLTVEWDASDATGVSSQSIALLDSAGSTLYSASLGASERELVLDDSTYPLDNATGYSLRLTVRGGSSLTTTVTLSFSTSFAEPARPDAGLSVDPSDLSAAVTAYAGSPSSDTGEVIKVPATPGTLVPGFTVLGNTRQNLWVNPSGTVNGVTVTSNDDGSVTVSGTANKQTNIHSGVVYSLRPGFVYYLSADRYPVGFQLGVSQYLADGRFKTTKWLYGKGNAITIDSDAASFTCVLSAQSGATVSGTYRVMLNEGSEAEPWCPPGLNGVDELAIVVSTTDSADDGTTTPIDLDGHALNSLPDGTRDELRIDGTGAVTLVQRVGVFKATKDTLWTEYNPQGNVKTFYTSTGMEAHSYIGEDPNTKMMCDDFPCYQRIWDGIAVTPRVGMSDHPSHKNSMFYNTAGYGPAASDTRMTVLYPLAEPQEVDLPGISMPAFPAAETQVFCASNVPCDVRVDYPDTESLSVTRVLADGSRWLVADGLTSGQQAIDPLPPLNVDFTYLVTAYAETGVASTQELPAHVDSGGMEAFNFGQGASIALLMGYNASGSESADHGGTLYEFATGDGSLPLFYPTGELTGSASRSYAVTSREHANRVRALSREYPEAWFRGFDGNRMLCKAAFSISLVQGSRDVRTIDVTMDECEFEEASNG